MTTCCAGAGTLHHLWTLLTHVLLLQCSHSGKHFSSYFGQAAGGIVYWIGDGNREEGAYQNDTIFAEYEFPELAYPRVYRLVAIVIQDCSKTAVIEGCEEQTVKILEDQAVSRYGRNTGYRCQEVCGNASNEQQIPSLARQCLQIIREEQEGGNVTKFVAN